MIASIYKQAWKYCMKHHVVDALSSEHKFLGIVKRAFITLHTHLTWLSLTTPPPPSTWAMGIEDYFKKANKKVCL